MMEKQSLQKPPVRDVNAAQRATLALKLREQRVKYEDIARMCGYGSAGAAHKAIQRELQRSIVANVEDLRREELASLDRLEMECWKDFTDKKNANRRLFVVDRILAIKERRARLMGLDAQKDANIALAQVVVREVPPGYLDAPQEPTP